MTTDKFELQESKHCQAEPAEPLDREAIRNAALDDVHVAMNAVYEEKNRNTSEDNPYDSGFRQGLLTMSIALDEATQKLKSQPAQHPDDAAVDAFAAAMKAKLAKKRAEGRGGWDTAACTQGYLSDLLIYSVMKQDPVDVANFCMMLQQRGENITLSSHQGPRMPSDTEMLDWLSNNHASVIEQITDLGPGKIMVGIGRKEIAYSFVSTRAAIKAAMQADRK